MSELRCVKLESHVVHVWQASTVITEEQEREWGAALSLEEMQRANRFHFPMHRRRFIAAHGILRNLLARYLDRLPAAVEFLYTQYKKPYLPGAELQFNVSHSHDRVVFAFTQRLPIGVDIEKIEPNFKESVAKRYFSEQEFAELMVLADAARVPAFYRVWSRKEAFVKALGLGLHFSLRDFSVSAQTVIEQLHFEYDNYSLWHIESFNIDPDYQAAFVTPAPVKQVLHWQWPLGLVQE